MPPHMGTGVKWRAVETDSPIPPPHVGNLPNEDPISGLDIKIIVHQEEFVAGHTLLHALHVCGGRVRGEGRLRGGGEYVKVASYPGNPYSGTLRTGSILLTLPGEFTEIII